MPECEWCCRSDDVKDANPQGEPLFLCRACRLEYYRILQENEEINARSEQTESRKYGL